MKEKTLPALPDENRLFATPFSLAYWRAAALEMTKLRSLVLAAVVIALRVAVSFIAIPVGESLKITFGFFFNALGSMIYGPIVALIGGAAEDIIGFFAFPSGYPFFFGYTLNAMLSSFIFAIFLYRTQLSFWRVAVSRACVNVFVNIFLGSLWSTMLYSKGFVYYIGKSYFKNLTLLPLEIILLAFFLFYLQPFLMGSKLIPQQNKIKITRTHIIVLVVACVLLALFVGLYVWELISESLDGNGADTNAVGSAESSAPESAPVESTFETAVKTAAQP